MRSAAHLPCVACVAALACAIACPAFADSHAPPSGEASARRTVIARLVDGERPIVACGTIAFIGVYVYEIESVTHGPPLGGRVVVDVLCPDFYLGAGKLRFARGERHLLELDRARRSYAGATAPPSPLATAPRFEAKKVSPAPTCAPLSHPTPPRGLVLAVHRTIVPHGDAIRHESALITTDGTCPAKAPCRRVSAATLARLYPLARAAAAAGHHDRYMSPHYGSRSIAAEAPAAGSDAARCEIEDSSQKPLREADLPVFRAAFDAIVDAYLAAGPKPIPPPKP